MLLLNNFVYIYIYIYIYIYTYLKLDIGTYSLSLKSNLTEGYVLNVYECLIFWDKFQKVIIKIYGTPVRESINRFMLSFSNNIATIRVSFSKLYVPYKI